LRLSGVVGTDYFAQKNALFFPPELHFEDDDGLPGSSLLSNSDNLNLNLDGNLVHAWTPSGGRFVATTSAGIQFARRELDIARIESRNLVAGQPNVDAGTSVRVREIRNLVKGLGLFAQEEVRLLDERFLLTAGVRADQSSLNADAAKLHYFPKAAISYQFGNVGFFSNLKLRAAWGQSGNEPLYGQRFTPLDATQSIGGLPGVVVAGVRGSADLKPERQREIEGGVDASVLNGRASLEASVYQKRITDLLLTRNLPTSSGFGAEIFNGGVLETNGIELALGLIPIQRARADWVLRTTFSTNDGTIEELPVPPFETGGFGNTLGAFEIREGQSATAIVGVDTTADGTSIVHKIGDANPDFRMSFSSDMRWGPFSLRGLVEWQQGSEVVNLTKLLSDFGQITPDYANPIPGSDETVGERRVAGAQVVAANYLESASYVKVRELALSWDIPINSIRRFWAGAQAARLSISARNPFTFTDYTGLDPEVSNFGNQPIARNIDVAPYPPSRQYWFSLDFSF
jgi:outer membrane receptor protein involved in Fe transport